MTNTKTSKETTKSNSDAKRVEKLEAQLKEQKEQIDALIAMLQQSNVSNTQNVSTEEISGDDEFLVISLTPNKLNLCGADGAILFAFDEMYEEQYIDYASLKEIVRVNRDMAKNGRFYILDEKVVNKLRLKNNYRNVLTPEQLKDLLRSDTKKAVELYKLANKTQQSTIIELVKQAKFRGEPVDFNLLSELEKLSGIKLIDIEDATQIEINNRTKGN
jgi:hypothetical protein